MSFDNLPKEERICTNCAHYVRKITLSSLLDLLLGDGESYHQCTLNGRKEIFNSVTGKNKVFFRSVSCQYQRFMSNECDKNNCSWEPSESWKQRKENLFKVLK